MRTSEDNRKKPFAWNRKAEKLGTRFRVFCSSLSDVFEDHPAVHEWRKELFTTIEATPHLDWQLLTKRPENLLRMLPQAWLDKPLPHVWLGTTVEDQKRANERIPHLLATPASVRFLSCEPLLEPVVLQQDWLLGKFDHCPDEGDECVGCAGYTLKGGDYCGAVRGPRLSWLIAGGESGPGARPFDLAWARSLRDQCASAGVPYFFKQCGSNAIDSDGFDVMNDRGEVAYSRDNSSHDAHALRDEAVRMGREVRPRSVSRHISDRAGADPTEFPEDLRVQQFPEVPRG